VIAARATQWLLVITLLAVAVIASLSCSTATPTPTTSPPPTPTETYTPSPSPTFTPTPTPEPVAYIVQPGDSLSAIASRFGTTYQAIMDANGLTSTVIHSGTRLRIRTGEKPLSGALGTVRSVPSSTPRPPAPTPTAEATATAHRCPQGCTYHPPGCDIKGNISMNTGEKIYHVRGAEYYDETIIRPEYGERWFCTQDEAIANGWRRSKV
jgi:LysM repeat protein